MPWRISFVSTSSSSCFSFHTGYCYTGYWPRSAVTVASISTENWNTKYLNHFSPECMIALRGSNEYQVWITGFSFYGGWNATPTFNWRLEITNICNSNLLLFEMLLFMRTQWQMTGVDESQLHFLEICKRKWVMHFSISFIHVSILACHLGACVHYKATHSHSLHLNKQWHIKNKYVGSFPFDSSLKFWVKSERFFWSE